ncbi:MAG: hypothetical protein QXO32_03155 [Candidatus Bathyarchaeia archaeon]
MGYQADVMVFSKHPFGFEEDYVFNVQEQKHFKTLNILYKLFKHKDYDIFHFHGDTILPFQLDEKFMNLMTKKYVFHYHGGELRNGFKIIEANSHKCLVSTLDLLNYTNKGVWLPNPVDSTIFYKANYFNKNNITVGTYVPVEPYVRKFALIDETIEAVLHLKSQGYPVEYKLLHNLPYNMVPEFLSTIDIWVDKFGANTYGTLAIEAALSECAVIAQYDQRYKEWGCPFINLPAKNLLKECLLELIENERFRLKIAERGRDYALRIHDPLLCAKNSIKFYEEQISNS